MEIFFSDKRSLYQKLFLVLLILQINFFMIHSDLPVHCKREEIEGVWTFRVESETFMASLSNPKTSCGHGFPDRIDKNQGDLNFRFDSYRDVELLLGADYKIYDPKNKNRVFGHWTPIYDEAFVVYYQNSVFTAFMKYYLKDESSLIKKDYRSNCDKTMIGWFTPDSNRNDMNWSCFFGFKSKIRSEFTHNRFLQTEKKKKQEINIYKNVASNFIEMSLSTQGKTSLSLKYDQKDLVNEINSMNLSWKADVHDEFKGLSFFELKEKLGLKRKKSRRNFNNKEQSKIFDLTNQPLSVSQAKNSDLNLENSLSTLEINKGVNQNSLTNLTNNKNIIEPQRIGSETSYNIIKNLNLLASGNSKTQNGPLLIVENFEGGMNKSLSKSFGKSFTKVNSDANNVDGNNINNSENLFFNEQDSDKERDINIIQKYLNKELNEIDETKLPKNWDWRNVGGVSYVPNPRRQLNCGSCYVFSLVSSLESRLRILTNNKDKTEFSRQFPLGCSFYTEGCNGGYPFLVAKFFNEFEIVPDSCAPYNPSNIKCSDTCDYTKNPIKYFVSKYEYLGGFYGATNEIELLKEIRARGPIPGNMSVPWTFSFYKNGIFSQNHLSKNSGKFSRTTLFDNNLSWSNVEHSILLVGYGEENGIKYWIGMNTWGEQWGENGYFRILRGENDCNIETMGDAARISFKLR